MNKDPGDPTTPVRRSGRARKPNSRFADDEVEGCFKKIVTGIGLPDTISSTPPSTTHGRPKKTVKKRESQSEDKDEADGGNKGAKDKTEVPNDKSLEKKQSDQEFSETVKSGKVEVQQPDLNALVNGLDKEVEIKKYSGKTVKSESEESGETGKKSTGGKKEEIEAIKEAKKRGSRTRSKGRKSEEESDDTESEITSAKNKTEVISKSKDKESASVTENDGEVKVNTKLIWSDTETKKDTSQNVNINPSDSIQDSNKMSDLGNILVCDPQIETSENENHNVASEMKVPVPNKISDQFPSMQNRDTGNLEKYDTSETVGNKKSTETELDEGNLCLRNGDSIVEGIPESDISRKSTKSSIEDTSEDHCSKKEKIKDSDSKECIDRSNYCGTSKELLVKDKIKDSSVDKGVSSDSKESSDGGSYSSGCAEEPKGKVKGSKSVRDRWRLTTSDSTDSTDSDTSSPARRRGRSGFQVLARGLGDDDESKGSPRPKGKIQQTKPEFSVMTPTQQTKAPSPSNVSPSPAKTVSSIKPECSGKFEPAPNKTKTEPLLTKAEQTPTKIKPSPTKNEPSQSSTGCSSPSTGKSEPAPTRPKPSPKIKASPAKPEALQSNPGLCEPSSAKAKLSTKITSNPSPVMAVHLQNATECSPSKSEPSPKTKPSLTKGPLKCKTESTPVKTKVSLKLMSSPAKHDLSLTKKESSPAKFELSLTEHEQSPTQLESSQSKPELVIAKCELLPTMCELLPTRHKLSPTKYEPSPSKHEPLPSKDEPSPSKHEPLPSKHEPSPSKHEPSPSKHEPSPSKHEPSPSKHEPSPSKHEPSPSKHEQLPTKHEPSPTKHKPSPTKNELLINKLIPSAAKIEPLRTKIPPLPVDKVESLSKVSPPSPKVMQSHTKSFQSPSKTVSSTNILPLPQTDAVSLPQISLKNLGSPVKTPKLPSEPVLTPTKIASDTPKSVKQQQGSGVLTPTKIASVTPKSVKQQQGSGILTPTKIASVIPKSVKQQQGSGVLTSTKIALVTPKSVKPQQGSGVLTPTKIASVTPKSVKQQQESDGGRGVLTPTKIASVTPKSVKQQQESDGGSGKYVENHPSLHISFDDIPLPPPSASAMPELPVKPNKGKRERTGGEQKRDEPSVPQSLTPEDLGMPVMKRRKENDSSSEQESQTPSKKEEDHKRKLTTEIKDKDKRKRRKFEHSLPEEALPTLIVPKNKNMSISSEGQLHDDVLPPTYVPPPCTTNIENTVLTMLHTLARNCSKENQHQHRSLYGGSVTSVAKDSKMSESSTAPVEFLSSLKASPSKKSDSSVSDTLMSFTSSRDSIPFITDKMESCEIPGLSIIASKNTRAETVIKECKPESTSSTSKSSNMNLKKQELLAVINDKSDTKSEHSSATGITEAARIGYSQLKNIDSGKDGASSKQVKEEGNDKENFKPAQQICISGSKVEDITSPGQETKLEDVAMTLKTEVEDSEAKVDETESTVGSKVEEVQLTEEEIKELETKRQLELEEKERKNKGIVEQRLKSFTHLEENMYLGERRKTKRGKEVRRMLCDCSLTKEEIARGDEGCGEDCLNRLLMIECGSRCPLKDRCTNKRFQRKEYGDVEVFNTEEKGCGLVAHSPIAPGTFIMEYVGEVFDTREFKRRRKEYARDHTAHFYFMALKSDQLIDATKMGNISRFINHSCDPNAETQKWTVNGELRVGFFSKKHIEEGEEINFDYRLERYGREPQKCYCGTPVCRGWLGESPDEKTKEEKDEERRKEERDKRKREERRAFYEDIDLEDEIEKLNSHKLRNRQDTLNLSRLLVRVEDYQGRLTLLDLLQTGEAACRRLFLDYHGLKVLWSLMADLSMSLHHTTLKLEILKTLECLPITNKTQLTDSRVLAIVERWSIQQIDSITTTTTSSTNTTTTTITTTGPITTPTTINTTELPPLPPPKPEECMLPPPAVSSDSDNNKKSSDTSEESDSEVDMKGSSNAIEASSADDSSLDSEVEQSGGAGVKQGGGGEEESSDSSQSDGKENPTPASKDDDEETGEASKISEKEKEAQELCKLQKSVVELALKLLDVWKNLNEFFRIPKKERIEMMKEHEREVDQGYKEYLDREQDSDRDWERDRRDQGRYARRDYYYDRRRRSPDRDRHGRTRSSRDDRSSDSPKMSKEKRRQLFELKVQQEEEEAKQRKMQEEMWAMHVDRCQLLGHDPYLTPIFDPTYQYYWDPVAANWQPYTGSDPNIPVPAVYGQHKGEGEEGSPLTVLIPGQGGHAGFFPPNAHPAPDDPLNPANIPLPGEIPTLSQASPNQPHPGQAVPAEGTPPQGAKVVSIPLPGELGIGGSVVVDPSATTLDIEDVEPPPSLPGPITIELPPRWKIARDNQGHVYFYHIKTRTSQWEPPSLDQHNQVEAELGSDSDTDSSSSDTDSTSTSESEDFSSEEEEEEVVETVTRGEVSREKMVRRVKGKRRRSEALVQERVISPIMEIDREAARRERREAKERAREEARQERQEWQEDKEVVEAVAEVRASSRDSSVTTGNRSRREKVKSKERAATAIADNSEIARKLKEKFRSRMATFIVSVLNPYRKGDCKEGKITCTEDFKYLARKLTHFVMVKELKQLHSIEALECSDSVKHKTRDFVRKYMSKYGSIFKRDPNDTKEY